ncbi:MAG: serpin family protein [Candidatus Micrarchaeota archaeon]|nr:serpin family protein [Candidatus Micrarchaeota archaeon]
MRRTLAFLTLVAFLLFGCIVPSPPDWNGKTGGPKTFSDVSNRFGYAIYSELAKTSEEKNIVISPYSITSAMAMVFEGAEGQTADEMEKVMFLPKNKSELRESFAGLYRKINFNSSGLQISTANALWIHRDYEVLGAYKETLKQNYFADAINIDFDSGRAEETINRWVEDRTNQKIKNLIPPKSISGSTPVVITNAVYFKGKWQVEFDKQKTTEEDFGLVSGANTKVMMMNHYYDEKKFNYTEDETAQVLELPYSGGKASMLLILPKENGKSRAEGIAAVEREIASGGLRHWNEALREEKVSIHIPKFKLEETYRLEGVLPRMGMRTAFSDSADFGLMTEKKNLKIGVVIHKVYVDVNEEGTEAAAATAVVMKVGSVGPGGGENIYVFRADRPFFFAIQDKDSGAVLFLGKVMNPSQAGNT